MVVGPVGWAPGPGQNPKDFLCSSSSRANAKGHFPEGNGEPNAGLWPITGQKWVQNFCHHQQTASNLKSFPRHSGPLLHLAQALLSTVLMPMGPATVAEFVVMGGEEPAMLLESRLEESVGCREMGSVALNKTAYFVSLSTGKGSR